MSWTDPTAHVFVTGENVTAATMNTYIQANLATLQQLGAAFVATSETTASATYTDLATSGPAVTITTGTKALVGISGLVGNNTTGDGGLMGFAISGATTLAANDNMSIELVVPGGTYTGAFGATFLVTGLTAGSNTFTAKYRAAAGTMSAANRRLWAMAVAAA